MFWFVWRRNRVALISLMVFGGLLALLHLVTALRIRAELPAGMVDECLHKPISISTDECFIEPTSLTAQLDQLMMNLNMPILLLPGLIAALVGGTLLAKELNNRTHQFLFTQQRSRLRWFAVASGTVLASVAVVAVVLSLGIASWTNLFASASPFEFFELDILVLPATAIFVTSFTMLVGAVTRRETLGVLSGPIAGWGTWLLFHNVLRPAYAAPLTTTDFYLPAEEHEMLDRVDPSRWQVGTAARDLETKELLSDTEIAERFAEFSADTGQEHEFVSAHYGMEYVYYYHPAERYWPFQFIETGILLGLTALCLGAAFWVVNRRTG